MACITPTHLYRKYLVWKVIREKIPKNSYFLEVGCGTGDFSLELANSGFSGIAIDFSEAAVKMAREKLKNRNVKVVKSDFLKFKEQFDIIFMFEVLEHIKNDKKAINKIFHLLKPGRRLLFSVPAHQRMYGRDDRWGGHYRRYEKENLIKILNGAGFTVEIFWCYGFPVFNFTRRVYNFLCKLKKKKLSKVRGVERAKKTGIEKEGENLVEKIHWLYPTLKPIFKFCDLFLNFDLGPGYICCCKKKKV